MGQIALPDNTAAQNRVSVQRRLPRRAEPLRIQALHPQAHLIDVITGILLQKAVEQHALLHRRERVNVFNRARTDGQVVELRLGQLRKREVRWCDANVGAVAAVLNQHHQLLGVVISQTLQGGLIKHFFTEGPTDAQLAAVHLAIEAQPVAKRCQWALIEPTVFCRRRKQGALIIVKTGVELTEVVEGDPGHRQFAQERLGLTVGQIAQHAEADTFVRDCAQLLFYLLDRITEAFDRRQAHWECGGEPAHAATEINTVKQVLTAMAFKLDQCRSLLGPGTDHTGQGGQQQVVDLRAICRRRLLQQALCRIHAQPCMHRACIAVVQTGGGCVAGQLGNHALQLRLPVGQLLAQLRFTGIALQALGPGFEGAGLGRQGQRQA